MTGSNRALAHQARPRRHRVAGARGGLRCPLVPTAQSQARAAQTARRRLNRGWPGSASARGLFYEAYEKEGFKP
jgi:hypothetical protein